MNALTRPTWVTNSDMTLPPIRRLGGDAVDEPSVPALIHSWRTEMVAANCADRTIETWPAIVRRAALATGLPAHRMTVEAIAYWLAAFTNGHTRRTYWVALTAWHRHLVAARVITDSPMDALKRPKLPNGCPRPVSTIGLHRLLDAPLRPRTRAQVILGAFLGLRVHEIAKVRGEDFDLDSGVIVVKGKGGRTDTLPLHPDVVALVETMPRHGWWFPSQMNPDRPIDPRTVTTQVKRAMIAAGVPGKPHGLRAWFATGLLRAGVDVRTVQTLMRHANLNTTQLYLEVVDEERLAAVLRLPGWHTDP